MKKSRFLVMTIALIIGICGLIVLTKFFGNWPFQTKNTMMGGGVMKQQQMKDSTRGMNPAIPSQDIKQSNLSERDDQGAKLLSLYCTQCHELPNPHMHRAEEWPSVVENMQDVMRSRGKPELADNEKKIITNYLIQLSR